MSVTAIMLVKDEADIIAYTLAHLKTQVDWIIVADNMSTDGTRDILEQLAIGTSEAWLDVVDDPDPAYYQSKKTTALAQDALERGFDWVLPCDADEVWYAPDGRPIRDWLDGLAPDIQIVTGDLYNHLPTAEDPEEPSPLRRLGWRKRERQSLGKVCCRTRPDLVIHAGNHGASTDGTAVTVGGLILRHFSWRTAEQYVRKIRNGQAAYAATDLPKDTGTHWRMWAEQSDEAVAEHFQRWFWSADPRADSSLIFDPAPVASVVD